MNPLPLDLLFTSTRFRREVLMAQHLTVPVFDIFYSTHNLLGNIRKTNSAQTQRQS
jgi:hypothetical protein